MSTRPYRKRRVCVSQPGEEWRPIPGVSPMYEISNFGRCRSWTKKGGSLNGPRADEPYEHVSKQTAKGYWRLKFRCPETGRSINRSVHSCVLEAFGSLRPEGLVCCHKDGNNSNNHIDNLEWKTQMENIHDKYAHGTMVRGESHPKAALTRQQAEKILRLYATGKHSQTELANTFGVSQTTISVLVSGRTWKHLPRPD